MEVEQLLNLSLFFSVFLIAVIFGLKKIKDGKNKNFSRHKEFFAVSLFMACFGLVFSIDIARSFLEVLTLHHTSGYMRLYLSGLGLLFGQIFVILSSFITRSKHKKS